MPYIKGRGIKDLYLIKRARVGSKQEVFKESSNNDKRIIFEIEKVNNLFDNYMPIHLNIWHTFTDAKLKALVKLKVEN